MMKRPLAVATLALSLVGCGGGGSPSPSPSPSPVPAPTPSPTPTPSPAATIIENVTYRQGATAAGSIPLQFDVYQPDAECASPRPTIVFVHGGGFFTGSRRGANVDMIAQSANLYGMNLVSITYRLEGDDPLLSPAFAAMRDELAPLLPATPPSIVNAAAAASEDLVGALDFLVADGSTYCVDPERLALWGGSAGAFASLQVAYGLDEFAIARPEVGVVVNYWGGLFRDSDMDAGDVPFFTLHGTADATVPYQSALDLAARADAVGVPYSFYTVDGGGHGFGEVRPDLLTVDGLSVLDLTAQFVADHFGVDPPAYRTATISP